MADIELVPEGEPEPLDATLTPEPDATPPDPLEEVATEMGWRPKDQYKGDEANWKPARDYIRAGKDIQTSTARELKEMRATLDNVSRTSATVAQQLVEQERAKLEARWASAVDEGDHVAAREADNRLRTLQAPQSTTPNRRDEFKANNSWFDDDPLATALALDVANRYALANKSADEQLAAAKREVERVYPHLAPKAAPQRQQASVAEPGSRAAPSAGKKSFHDLPPAAQAVARDMEDRLNIPVATYVTNYFAAEGKAR